MSGPLKDKAMENQLNAALARIKVLKADNARLAALAESAEPLTEESAEVADALAAVDDGLWIAADVSDWVPKTITAQILNRGRAPLLAHIQALEAERDQARVRAQSLSNSWIDEVDHRVRVERQRDAAIEALRRYQWNNDGLCPECWCSGYREKAHRPTCSIGRVLAASQPNPETTND